ncbi:type II secretion system F family protein [Streptomyces sp. NPDC087908]|uniref:type II secretion system F family protein n=1 Tax=unclassified Streptomyces TaxID=2593676 RepID=UPI00311FB557
MSGAVRMAALAVAALLACELAVRELVARRRARGVRRRWRGLLPASGPPRRKARAGPPRWAGHWLAPLGAAGLGWVLFGALGALVAAGVVAVAMRRRTAGRSAAPVDTDDDAARHLPLAADLLAACASAGAGPGEAAEAVGRSLGGPLGERLSRTAAELRLGGDPAEVWRRFGALPGAVGLARCLERAGSSGAPAAEAVARHAAALRSARARTAATRARRAQVLISGPVGLCFLPAFLAVGVAPVVIGLAAGLLDGGGG